MERRGEKVLVVEENQHGRDFVCGDIHGCFDILLQELEKINFDWTHDRIFCTGDLINKGNQSHQIVDFLNMSNFYAVKGNHEKILFDLAVNKTYKENGHENIDSFIKTSWSCCSWFLSLDKTQRRNIINVIYNMPYAIEIKQKNTLPIGIVHADIPYEKDKFIAWHNFKYLLEKGDYDTLNNTVWSKKRFQENVIDHNISGLEKLYCGHKVVAEPTFLGNACFIDTGCVYKKDKNRGHKNPRLTIIEI